MGQPLPAMSVRSPTGMNSEVLIRKAETVSPIREATPLPSSFHHSFLFPPVVKKYCRKKKHHREDDRGNHSWAKAVACST